MKNGRHWAARRFLAAAALAIAMVPVHAAPAEVEEAEPLCHGLQAGQQFGDATIMSAMPQGSGKFTSPTGKTEKALPSHCRIIAVSRPSSASNIVIEVWLPRRASWNGKLLATGNGGFAGAIRYDTLAGGLRRGYAVTNTDMGTYPAALPGVGYGAGNGRPEAVKDWGFRSTHEMTLLAKAVIAARYGKQPAKSLFVGCSTGGHQGLAEAQRFPEDFDGILAGAPGHNRTHLHAMFADLLLKMQRPGGGFTPASLKLWTDSYRKACVGKDGGAPGDIYLTDPTKCDYSPRELLCRPGQDDAECLTQPQVGVLEAIYDGTRNPRTGELIYPPVVRGVEAMLAMGLLNPDIADMPVPEDLHRWVFGPGWDAASFDFDEDMDRVDAVLGRDVNALDTDLSAFEAHGGKIILYHGWADLVVSPLDTIAYFDRLHARGGPKANFARLFMAPGVSHCAGGDGADLFGQAAEIPAAGPKHDLIAALDAWVEGGPAPDTVLARKFGPVSPEASIPDITGAAKFERPLCAYPKVAHYDGIGDPAKPSSFVCKEAPANYSPPAPKYLGSHAPGARGDRQSQVQPLFARRGRTDQSA